MSKNPQAQALFERVIQGKYCIGCGACAAWPDSPFEMTYTNEGMFEARPVAPQPSSSSEAPVLNVCPFSGEGANEEQLGAKRFGAPSQFDKRIGFYRSAYAGHVTESGYRDRGSSGGMATWLGMELLERKLVDGLIHVHPRTPTAEDPRLFGFRISYSKEDVFRGAKSRYYPVHMADMLKAVREKPGRYALIGVPCFIKAARLLAEQDDVFKQRLSFFIGLFCGHLKSAAFAEFLGWQYGIDPGKLLDFDFRKKLDGAPADRYGIELTGLKDGHEIHRVCPMSETRGGGWGLGYFKYRACDYCDDVVAETADVSVGDAWLPEYVQDSRGTNIIVVRHPDIQKLLDQGLEEGRLSLKPLDADAVAASQAGGFRHRREGLSYRLYLAHKQGAWHPVKRVPPSRTSLTSRQRRLFKLRIRLAAMSHSVYREAVRKNDLEFFFSTMKPLQEKYGKLYRGTLLQRIMRRLNNPFNKRPQA